MQEGKGYFVESSEIKSRVPEVKNKVLLKMLVSKILNIGKKSLSTSLK